MAFKFNKNLFIFSFERSVRKLFRRYFLPFGIFLFFNFCGEAQTFPLIDKTENTLSARETGVPSNATVLPSSDLQISSSLSLPTPSLLPTRPPSLQNQPNSLPQPQSTSELQDNEATALEKLSSQLEIDLQSQVSRYDALVERAKILKQDWDNTGSLISLHRYNALIRDIQMINDSLKIMGGTTLPDLPLLTLNQAEEFSNTLEEDLLETDKEPLENWASQENNLNKVLLEEPQNFSVDTFPHPPNFQGVMESTLAPEKLQIDAK
ncbi:MAG: hypothetical protein B7Y25_00445 [Alphaproteobacteria bacterium 16-39-46]|nr:MAG: hypothetical protein B7Y79_00335 [Rhodospirillales bacterium 35-44-4]OYZ38589.1 MAG: hypothetical protein B7Y25_00445 [Alphaproteobacteria bacterium 16-39-46]OZA44429.1 MAG: hypothetical protein B7X84_00475 [Alphaproteobacteria bacterium 17-39-52]HQS83315.1 hypothetical protein [Alphaproteobacteria bacterium]HQS93143.1 hypothetical protein [Alphaproteobacteria bacterium]